MDWPSPWTVAAAVAAWGTAQGIGKWRIGHLESTQRIQGAQVKRQGIRQDVHDTRLAVLERSDRETRRLVREAEERAARQTADIVRRIDELFNAAMRATPPPPERAS